jgi:hypothetical protein
MEKVPKDSPDFVESFGIKMYIICALIMLRASRVDFTRLTTSRDVGVQTGGDLPVKPTVAKYGRILSYSYNGKPVKE